MCAAPIREGTFLSCAACRSDEERERDGTPALTAGAIGRGAAVPLPYISGALSRNVRNANELAYQIAATVATGLVQVMLECTSIRNPLVREVLQCLETPLTIGCGSKQLDVTCELQECQHCRFLQAA